MPSLILVFGLGLLVGSGGTIVAFALAMLLDSRSLDGVDYTDVELADGECINQKWVGHKPRTSVRILASK